MQPLRFGHRRNLPKPDAAFISSVASHSLITSSHPTLAKSGPTSDLEHVQPMYLMALAPTIRFARYVSGLRPKRDPFRLGLCPSPVGRPPWLTTLAGHHHLRWSWSYFKPYNYCGSGLMCGLYALASALSRLKWLRPSLITFPLIRI